MIFGITLSVCDTFLKFGIHLLEQCLRQDPVAKCVMPDQDTIQSFFRAIQSKHPPLHDCWGVVDGLKLYLSECGDSVIQNVYYNGWTTDCYIGNLFVFTPDGCIAYRVLNAPGMQDNVLVCLF